MIIENYLAGNLHEKLQIIVEYNIVVSRFSTITNYRGFIERNKRLSFYKMCLTLAYGNNVEKYIVKYNKNENGEISVTLFDKVLDGTFAGTYPFFISAYKNDKGNSSKIGDELSKFISYIVQEIDWPVLSYAY